MQTPTSNNRYAAVDALRGLLMMIMVIDHANAYAARQHSSEFWAGAMTSYTSGFAFFTRWITHLCAPGFFLLMGAGIVWFAEARRKAGWTEGRIMQRVAWRGFVLLLVGQLLENPILFLQGFLAPATQVLSKTTQPPPIDGTALYWGFIVMSGLGMVSMLCSLLLRARTITLALVGIACVWATHFLLPGDGKPGPLWETLLLAPGLSQHVIVMYPALPWLAVSVFGMCFGRWWSANRERAPRLVLYVGIAILLFGLGVRAAGGIGNIRLPRDRGVIEFLNTVKYPPALVFWTVSVGIDLILLGLLVRLPDAVRSLRSPLMIFGQTPAFFYVAHLYLLCALGFLFFRQAVPLWMVYPVWIVVLALLYPVCVWYRGFKTSKPAESFWRLL